MSIRLQRYASQSQMSEGNEKAENQSFLYTFLEFQGSVFLAIQSNYKSLFLSFFGMVYSDVLRILDQIAMKETSSTNNSLFLAREFANIYCKTQTTLDGPVQLQEGMIWSNYDPVSIHSQKYFSDSLNLGVQRKTQRLRKLTNAAYSLIFEVVAPLHDVLQACGLL